MGLGKSGDFDLDKVRIVKLEMIPSESPRGRCLPLPLEAEKTMGRSGQMHGARIVMSPERKAKNNSVVMALCPCP